jgi:hypothetical protein
MALWRDNRLVRRRAFLYQLRHTDPDLARELAASTWKAEGNGARARFMPVFGERLSMADEPFLEMLLDDRSLMVRRKAAELLASLPESRLCGRMTAVAPRLLRWKDGRLAVNFPAAISPQMVRDGVVPRGSGNPARLRGNQLVQIVGAIPLEQWTEMWGETPVQILAAAQGSRWPRTLVKGFARAALRQRDVTWAVALLAHDFSDSTIARLVTVLPLATFEKLAQQAAQVGEPLSKTHPLALVLRQWRADWSEGLARLWLALLLPYLGQETAEKSPNPMLRGLVKRFAEGCPPGLLAEAEEGLRPFVTQDTIWRTTAVEVVTMLAFRRQMNEAVDD